jgi:hypothetical protein
MAMTVEDAVAVYVVIGSQAQATHRIPKAAKDVLAEAMDVMQDRVLALVKQREVILMASKMAQEPAK